MNIIVELVTPGRFFKDAPIHSLNEELKKRGFEVVFAADQEDLLRIVDNNARLAGVLIDWEESPKELIRKIHDFNDELPIFAFSSSNDVTDASFEDLNANVEFFGYEISNAADIAVTISQKVKEYTDAVLPPLTRALFNFAEQGKYTFCTPGHMSGTAFQRSPAGTLFYDFFGSNTFKADVSVSVGELGSLLDHTGPHKEAEKYIAETFNADRSYIVTNGTSTANKIIGLYAAPAHSLDNPPFHRNSLFFGYCLKNFLSVAGHACDLGQSSRNLASAASVLSLNGNITKFHYHTSLINFGFSGAYMKNLSRSMFENFRHASKLADYTTTYFIIFRRECVKKIVVTVQGPPKDFFLRLLLRKRFLLSACSIISSRRFSGSVSVSSFFWISPFRNSARSSPTLL